MAIVDLLTPTTSATTSTTFKCNGVTKVSVGIYSTSNVNISERVGAKLEVQNPAGWVTVKQIGKPSMPLILSDDEPQYIVLGTGTYRVNKDATTQAIGVYTDDGT